MPDIDFINSPKSEQGRLRMTARVIGEGFYSRNGFVVVPELDARMSPTAQVVYPKELAYERVDTEPWEKEW